MLLSHLQLTLPDGDFAEIQTDKGMGVIHHLLLPELHVLSYVPTFWRVGAFLYAGVVG